MRTIAVFLGLTILLLFNLRCLKDEIDEVQSGSNTSEINIIDTTNISEGNRNGTLDLIFYRTSLSTDNYLLNSSPNNKPRTHVIYNKKKVRNIEFNATPNGSANISGVFVKHYIIKINYIDNTIDTLTAYSKSSTNVFIFTPSGTNELSDSHTAKKIVLEFSGRSSSSQIYNFWRNTKTSYNLWNIYSDNTFIQQRTLDPLNKNSTQFMPNHIY